MALPAGIERLAPVALFTFERHPDLPLRDYASGRLGLIAPTYARSYLYVAYRWMDGAPMAADEVDGVDRYWRERLGLEAKPEQEESYDTVRASVSLPWQAPERPNGQAAAQYLAVDYVYYSKCSDDAFLTAARTLKARIADFGAESREVAEWVRGQDYVFENCFGAGSGYIPPELGPGINSLIRADRD
ncbi:MAG: hypothetical protein KDC27_08180, partial [Acidobacteria bacterium]|nr:hypothetical protein [Acidobacteriota bacterium]